MSKVGDVVIICPVCGESASAGVELTGVDVYATTLFCRFRNVEIKHQCSGVR